MEIIYILDVSVLPVDHVAFFALIYNRFLLNMKASVIPVDITSPFLKYKMIKSFNVLFYIT